VEEHLEELGQTAINLASNECEVHPFLGCGVARYVVSRPGAHVTISGRDFIMAGHVGILDYDGAWINAGPKTVNKFPHLTPPGGEYQPARMRKKN